MLGLLLRQKYIGGLLEEKFQNMKKQPVEERKFPRRRNWQNRHLTGRSG
jgi:hypothetical protein